MEWGWKQLSLASARSKNPVLIGLRKEMLSISQEKRCAIQIACLNLFIFWIVHSKSELYMQNCWQVFEFHVISYF